MGGFHKTLGQVYKPIRKVVDPLNIMDPFQILPGSSSGFTKGRAFTLDPNYGGPLKKMLGIGGGGGSASYSMPRSKMDTSEMMSGQNQMLANMQSQFGSDLERRNASNKQYRLQASANLKNAMTDNAQLRKSSPIFHTSPILESSVASQESSVASLPTTVAQSKIDGTTNIASDLPVEFVYKPATSASKTIAANTFNLPDMSNIKFGGT